LLNATKEDNVAVTAYAYNKGLYNLAAGNIHWVSDTFKVALLPSTYSPDIDAHHYYSDISGDECPASGNYAAGGVTLSNKTLTEDDGNDLAMCDCDDPSWADLTQADVRYAVLYKDTGTANTSVLLLCWDFGVNQAPSAETFSLPVPATGLFEISKG
jgi:hypothetical protein